MKENIEVAKRGGKIAGNARVDLEKEIYESVITKNNALSYQYDEQENLYKTNKGECLNEK